MLNGYFGCRFFGFETSTSPTYSVVGLFTLVFTYFSPHHSLLFPPLWFASPMPSPHPGELSSQPSTPTLSLLHSPSSGRLYRESWHGSETPYSVDGSRLSTLTDKFSLAPDPRLWGSDLSTDLIEADDAIHNPDVEAEKLDDKRNLSFSRRGLANLGSSPLLNSILAEQDVSIGYPVISYLRRRKSGDSPFNIGGVNSTSQVPSIGNFGLIDFDTPKDVYTKASYKNGSPLKLVFSDEFNTDGRSFYPGDDPYWEAVDLHYWVAVATNNLEWYDPAAVTTEDGSLVITFSQTSTHGLNYQGGLISSWNKFCFTGGMIEASVQLPGINNVVGMWPAIWTMGNLGRAGYGATLEGMWPYTYDSCDVGTAPNQTLNGLPYAATIDGDRSYNDALSVLPGQRLSRCTCDGESHPGPKHSDGTYVGRAAPEIDMFEAQVTGHPKRGQVSQSAQFAPFNRAWIWQNTTENMIVPNPSVSQQNTFIGSATQQATSVVTDTSQLCYEQDAACYSVYAFEVSISFFSIQLIFWFVNVILATGYDDAYISWVSENQTSWTMNAAGVGPDPTVEISARPIPQEPMYMIVNLGMSKNFGTIDFEHLTFPNHLRVDYIRVYQPPDAINIGCNPKDFPTEDYINQYISAYTNPNLTTWRGDFGQPFPKNSFLESC
ncbi:Beta-glucan synthesis-associated protein KRE6 [Hypsizygus marmoreus]|uniref:Beta-glucan synthesis-associated protein KRE6 n=1 Tax=Hypsizygus marmoreus TaxID=39966 RepID=A0A369JKJ3_HYPMA|nr:Beta-glucan synthesis-associated protein KRE6 [Hypsizygus marmoreus]